MIKAKLVQIPDYSEYIGKTFLVTEDFDWLEALGLTKEERKRYYKNAPEDEEFCGEIEDKLFSEEDILSENLYVGTTFTIKKIKDTTVTIHINREGDALDKIVTENIKTLINDYESEVKVYDTIIGWWTEEEDKFYIDKELFNNYYNGGGHCINTGFNGIPFDHPDKYGMAKAHYDDNGVYSNDDSIMTMDYTHKEGKLNIYSYQRSEAVYYSKTCYEFMRLGTIQRIEDFNSDKYLKKESKRMKKRGAKLNVNALNKIKFTEV